MADEEKQHLFANDGSDWTTPPSPVSTEEARKADKELDPGKDGEGFSGTNEGHLSDTIVEGSESKNG